MRAGCVGEASALQVFEKSDDVRAYLLELSARLDQGGAGVGFLPRQAELALRVERIPLIGTGGARLFAAGSVQRLTWFGDRSALTAVTAGLNLDLANGMAVALSAERNPFVLTGARAGGWFYGLKVEHAVALPRLTAAGSRGVVFQDLNGNGIHDSGEPGLAGVLVRRGGESGATGSDGSFHFSSETSGPVSLDPLSLPMGWIQEPSNSSGRNPELGVVAVAALEVALQLAPDALGRVSLDQLAGASIRPVRR